MKLIAAVLMLLPLVASSAPVAESSAAAARGRMLLADLPAGALSPEAQAQDVPPPAAPVPAKHYVRPLDPSHVQQSAAVLYDTHGAAETVAVTDIGLLTHSTADGTIMPESCRETYCPPEDLVILGIGGGGSLKGDAVIDLNTSINVAPQIGALLFAKVNNTSPLALQAVKAAFLGSGGNGVRIGYAFAGKVVKAGVFQSFKEAFPGQGLAGVLTHASKIEGGYAWTWGSAAK